MTLRRHHAALVLAIAVLAMPGTAFTARVPADVSGALDLYARGEYAKAMAMVAALDEFALGQYLSKLTTQADQWTRAGNAAEIGRRRMVAAAFAVDAAYRIRADPGTLVNVIAFGCQLSKPSPPSLAEYWWFRATVEMLVGASQWSALTGAHGNLSVSVLGSFAAQNEMQQGHLWHARTTFPAEPRWRLVSLDEAEAGFKRAGRPHGTPDESIGALRRDEFSAADVALLMAPIVDRTEQARRARASWQFLEQALFAAGQDPDASVRSNAFLRQGYWRICLRDWSAGLATLARVEAVDPRSLFLKAMFQGWAWQRLDRPDQAAAAYQRAVDRAPGARSATVLLAALRFLEGHRDVAYTLLEDALELSTPAPDPWVDFKSGEPGLVTEYLASMREALR